MRSRRQSRYTVDLCNGPFQTLRRFGGRQPLCAQELRRQPHSRQLRCRRSGSTGSWSRDPTPGPFHDDVDLAHTVLHTVARRGPSGGLRRERGRLAGALEADVAGRGPRDRVALVSVVVTIVLLNVDLMCATPVSDDLASRRLGRRPPGRRALPIRFPLLCGSSGPTPSPRLNARNLLRRPSCRRPSSSGPCGCGRWCACAGRAREAPPVPDARVAADLDLALDVVATSRRSSPSTFRLASIHARSLGDLLFGQVADLLSRRDLAGLAHLSA